MLDLHAVTGTPGAALVLGSAYGTICTNDGATVAGVPLRPDATLMAWGASSITANTVAVAKLNCPDITDPATGESIVYGTTSLKNITRKFTNIPYSKGAHQILVGTNTGVANGIGYLLDYYPDMPVVDGRGAMFSKGQVTVPQLLNADVAVTWVQTAFAPSTPLINGTYALLGYSLDTATAGHGIRFSHADFKGLSPGFFDSNHNASAILGWQEGCGDMLSTADLYQFAMLSQLTGKPMCPVFRVGAQGTGLTIESLAVAAVDTPRVNLNLLRLA